jgi:hypothetical protein
MSRNRRAPVQRSPCGSDAESQRAVACAKDWLLEGSSLAMKGKVLFLSLVFYAAVGMWLWGEYQQRPRVLDGLGDVMLGMTPSQVVGLLGRPTEEFAHAEDEDRRLEYAYRDNGLSNRAVSSGCRSASPLSSTSSKSSENHRTAASARTVGPRPFLTRHSRSPSRSRAGGRARSASANRAPSATRWNQSPFRPVFGCRVRGSPYGSELAPRQAFAVRNGIQR